MEPIGSFHQPNRKKGDRIDGNHTSAAQQPTRDPSDKPRNLCDDLRTAADAGRTRRLLAKARNRALSYALP